MLAYTYVEQGKFALLDKPKPVLQNDRDAIVRVTLASICTSDLHIKHGSVPQAAPGITVGHEMVGVVEEVGAAVTTVKPGDRVRRGDVVGEIPEKALGARIHASIDGVVSAVDARGVEITGGESA